MPPEAVFALFALSLFQGGAAPVGPFTRDASPTKHPHGFSQPIPSYRFIQKIVEIQ
jgi:hypothetical protein